MKKSFHLVDVLTVLSVSTFIFITPGIAVANKFMALDFKHQKGDFDTTTTSTVTALNFSLGLIEPQYDLEAVVPLVNNEVDTDTGSVEERGIGDIVVRGGHKLFTFSKQDVELYGSMAIKLPTADETKGLGSGETDMGLFLAFNKSWQAVSTTLSTGYIVNGDPPDQGIKDIFTYGIGVSRYFDKSSAYISLDGQQSTVDNADNPLAVYTGFYRILTYQYLLRGELSLGISDGSPDYGLSFGIIKVF